MIWHATGKCTEPSKMQHPVDGRAWKKFDTMYLDFSKEPRNVRLGLAANGFNPFGNLSQAYSMWPVILTTYNMPPWLCMKESSFMKTLLIPGPKSLGKDIYVYLRPLIEDLKVFRSVCKLIGLRSFIRFDAQELKKVKWYVLHNSPEIDTYRSQFKSLFPNKDMKEEFPDWFGSQIRQRHVDNDKDKEVSTTSELFALACRPTWTPISVNSCVVDSVRYVVHSRDECRITQNNGICSPSPDEEMYYGQLQEILEFKGEAFKNDQYILITEVKQVLYIEDKAKPHWKVVEHVNHKKFSNGGVIMVEDDPDIIHFDNSSNLPLSTSLNDLDNATLHIDGQSTDVDAPPDIIDVPEEDDDIIDDEDALPHDLADFDDEDLINVDDDVVQMSVDVAQSHGDDGGGVDRPPPHLVPTGCEGFFANRCKGKRKPNLGGRTAGRLHTRDKTRNLSLKEITDKKGPVLIRFEATHGILNWTEINAGIQWHLQKAYNTNKAAYKAQHWVIDPETETYNVEKIRQARPEGIIVKEWDKYMLHPQTGPGRNKCLEA
nr:hypothetical protein [Tanacetum cinerariifolium]